MEKNLETSLRNLKTDYIDIYQLHNPESVPDEDEQEGIYQVLLSAKKKGLIRYIGFTNHRIDTAMKAIKSGLFDTLQFPLNYLSSDKELELVEACRENDLGFIAMKGLSGGLISNVPATFTFLRQLGIVVPIWGLQFEWELDEFLALEKNPPIMNDEMLKAVERDKKELAGSFCRACGYCQPCPQGIPISTAARITFMMKRMPFENFISDEWKDKMELVTKCTQCGQCKKRCPYGLDIPNVLKNMLGEYREFVKEHS
jgi:predicted aldo/keto reductase-like oxidoreductase